MGAAGLPVRNCNTWISLSVGGFLTLQHTSYKLEVFQSLLCQRSNYDSDWNIYMEHQKMHQDFYNRSLLTNDLQVIRGSSVYRSKHFLFRYLQFKLFNLSYIYLFFLDIGYQKWNLCFGILSAFFFFFFGRCHCMCCDRHISWNLHFSSPLPSLTNP